MSLLHRRSEHSGKATRHISNAIIRKFDGRSLDVVPDTKADADAHHAVSVARLLNKETEYQVCKRATRRSVVLSVGSDADGGSSQCSHASPIAGGLVETNPTADQIKRMHTVSSCHLCSAVFLSKRSKDHLKGKHSYTGEEVITGMSIIQNSERNVILRDDLRKGQRITDDMIERVLTRSPSNEVAQSPSVITTDGVRVPIKGKGIVSKTLARYLTRTYRKRHPNLTHIIKKFSSYMRPLVKNPDDEGPVHSTLTTPSTRTDLYPNFLRAVAVSNATNDVTISCQLIQSL